MLHNEECLELVREDLISRAAGAAPPEPRQRVMSQFVSLIRSSGALIDPSTATAVADEVVYFSDAELATVLSQIQANSTTITGCYAAVKASPSGGRRLTLAIANLSLFFQLLPSALVLREFAPIHKKGPLLVRSMGCLRPISMASELAAVLDGLILHRHGTTIQQFWGPNQCGGVYEALATVLAVILLCELRDHVGLLTFLAFADLATAFDVAAHDDLRAGVFLAGVRGRVWMLIDDLLRSDRARLRLAGTVTDCFKLAAGTAQGRRLSLHLFNCLMRFLHDAIGRRTPGVFVPSLSNHPFTVVNLQYSDDLLAPADSPAQLQTIFNGCEDFTRDHGPKLNIGATKSAVMGPMFSDPPLPDEGAPCYMGKRIPPVLQYKYLGVILDRMLMFGAHFAYLLARGRDAFSDFIGTARSLGLPIPLQAAAIPPRIASVVFHGLEFCISVPGAELGLNRLQVDWAKELLGCGGARGGPWPIWVTECGWPRRLGTLMLERAIILKARFSLLPPSHPAAQLLILACESSGDTWVSRVSALQYRADFSCPIQDIADFLTTEETSSARSSKETRSKLLLRYRRQCVDPVLQEYDSDAFGAACHNSGWPYADLQPRSPLSSLGSTGDRVLGHSTSLGQSSRPLAGGPSRCSASACCPASLTFVPVAVPCQSKLNIFLPIVLPQRICTIHGRSPPAFLAGVKIPWHGQPYDQNFLQIASLSLCLNRCRARHGFFSWAGRRSWRLRCA